MALKVLRPELASEGELVQRFLREAKAMARLTSPHTIRLYDFGVTAEGMPFFTMELLEGETLAAYLEREAATLVTSDRRLAAACPAIVKGPSTFLG